ncbi:7,8-didemethyl-8-hydroxy-5-deazariboflavin synthase subunit CofG [Methanonatronarchaeum sp. AMET-Sl]|uniref:7,8-didemethyl-8-hydroxy-5-deazariboflavin synthase subunit CofG n=1 Tax=Methanonatronarchaeum sp. AMET-Sl TaxID=3037654 RepID=UPI00244E0C7F|nr:7,8-didemethyl-8-hydroxy-5-deazariboflavin synthase subunit CofG [Methanonatronarchaeum sp. AMET-Sl]WGI17729.1 7,8-didemethyl-8-hydroxy-5-deazariboflavin synthase subunit CofG [Methanonatronarchaeum sp. AMET-Sl]
MFKIDFIEKAGRLRDRYFDTITYSRNVFVPLTNVCRNNCSYCGFSKGKPYLLSPKQIKNILKEGKRSGAVEALFTYGEQPTKVDGFKKLLTETGYESFDQYLKDTYQTALDQGLLPHTNPGYIPSDQFKSISKYNASMGLMLETTTDIPSHKESPGKKPEKRIQLIKYAGKQKIPLTTGILIGVGESWVDRVKSLKQIKKINDKYGHIQEVIIQGHQKHPKSNTKHPTTKQKTVIKTIALARHILKDIEIQAPPNLHPDIKSLLKAGVSDLGGISTTKDHINPTKKWPSPQKLEKEIKKHGYKPEKRLPIYPKYIEKDWLTEPIRKQITKIER